MAIYAVNNTTGPEKLCPTLLLFGGVHLPARVKPSRTQIQRAETIYSAMEIVSKAQAKARIAFGLRHSRGPKVIEDRHKLEDLPAGARVRIY